jgi:alpha-beta hydrolase superfamily lysophospholipase
MPPAVTLPRLERWLRTRGGRLRAERYPRPQARGEARAWRLTPAVPRARVVFAHGTGNDALYPQAALFRWLLAAGCEVYAFDLEGHGREGDTRFAADSIRGAVPAAVAQAGREGAVLPLYLAGHSLGAALLLDALAGGSVQARAALLVALPLRLSLGVSTALRELGGFLRPATLRQREHYGLWGTLPAAGPFKRAAYPLRGLALPGRPFAYAAAVGRLLDELQLGSRCASLSIPLLLACGSRDRLAPPQDAARLSARLPQAHMLELSGATHWSALFHPALEASIPGWLETGRAG